MYKVIALMGAAGSGKDTLLNAVEVEAAKKNIPIHKIVSCTTRPPRDYETNLDYCFLSNDEFAEKVLNMDMLEATNFNGWFYGTSIDSLSKDKVNIGVFNPDGVRSLQEDPRINLSCFYIYASDKTRFIRQLNRENNPDIDEIIRRYKTDKEDFSDLEDIHYFITLVNEHDIQDIVPAILMQVQYLGQE